MSFTFLGTCVDLPGELVNAIRHDPLVEDLTLDEFREHMSTADFERWRGYDDELPLESDWHVSYHRSHMPGDHPKYPYRVVYYIVWSAIEHFWVRERPTIP